MIINKNLCKNCGKCAPQCAKSAIIKDDDGQYYIDQSLCIDCADYFEIECIRVCKFNAITRKDGTVPEFDKTRRIISVHIPYFIAIMGARGNTERFTKNHREYIAFRKLISDAYTDPDLKVRVVYGFDEICTGCDKRHSCGEGPGVPSFERLGIEPGTIIKLWDLVKLVEDKYSIPFLKKCDPNLDDDFFTYMSTFFSPDAKFFTNKN